MSAVHAVKSMFPPLLWEGLKRAYRVAKGHKAIYRPQIYRFVRDLPEVSKDPWSSPNWLNYVAGRIEEIKAHTGPEVTIHVSGLICSILAAMDDQKRALGNVTVLDVGGGVGLYYLDLKHARQALGIETRYAVVDGRRNCEIGRMAFRSSADVDFFDFDDSGLEKAVAYLGNVDVCNISSTLHLILNWRDALTNIVACNPTSICISRVPTPDRAQEEAFIIEQLTTTKGYCGDSKAVLIPREQLFAHMKSLGYFCISDTGNIGDASCYWQYGCDNAVYRTVTIRCFVFVRQRS